MAVCNEIVVQKGPKSFEKEGRVLLPVDQNQKHRDFFKIFRGLNKESLHGTRNYRYKDYEVRFVREMP